VTQRKLRIAVGLLASVAILAVVAFLFATNMARRLYLQRSAVALEPTFELKYAEANARLPKSEKVRVVVIGDSRVELWKPEPTVGPALELVWRGAAGETTAQLRHRYRQDTKDIGAGIVVIQSGINDVVAGVALGQGAEAVRRAFENIRVMTEDSTQDGIQVLLLTVIPPATPPLVRRVVWSDSIYSLVGDLNVRLRSLERPGVVLIDAARVLCGDADRLPGDMALDTLHFLQPAYERLNTELKRALDHAAPGDSEHAVQ
jgi:lysophospholipase L1-like esterase